MIRIGLDNTKCHVLIYGCPECDDWNTKNQFALNYEFGHWNLTYSPSLKSYADAKLKRVNFCPSCGAELPDLNDYRVQKQETC